MVTSQATTVVTDHPGAGQEQPARREHAPGRLGLVQDFVNTLDVEAGTDEIASPEGLAAWFRERSLLARGDRVGRADVARTAALRESLRRLLFAHHGDPVAAPDVGAVNDTAADARLTLRFEGPDGYRLEPQSGGVTAALGWIVSAVSEAIDAGTWQRLKACRNDTCQWAFYDSSRNRSGSWCTMAVCGNRMKSRAYRQRQHEERAASTG